MQKIKRFAIGALSSLALVAGAASAQTASIDVSGVTSVYTEVLAAAGVLGVAWLSMKVGIKAYQFLARFV